MAVRTALVPVSEIFALRREVLRPGLPPQDAVFPGDEDDAAFHVAAYDDAGAVMGCATFLPEPAPAAFGALGALGAGAAGEGAYRIRGVASDPAARGRGYGAAVLAAGTEEAARRGVALLWCTGRTSARGFWDRQGFEAVGEEFDIPGVGPHLHFARPTA